ncbi:hypothetical protein [Aeoliella sp.]|uniref:hypothetical protein n=1 Tax=Aeoliella sp. TaxID=2795800 RepID=UPI003CCC175D
MRITSALAALLTVITLTASSKASITLSFYDANYLGHIYDAQPASPTDEVSYIKDLITLGAGDGVTDVNGADYDRLNSTLAGPFDMPSTTDDFRGADSVYQITLTESYQYIYGKYDGPNYGAEVWYFPNGITGMVTLPQYPKDYPNQYALSHASAYNQVAPVPEAGSFIVWGTLAITGLSLCRRKLFG